MVQAGWHLDRVQSQIGIDLTGRRIQRVSLNVRASRRNEVAGRIQMKIAGAGVELTAIVFNDQETLPLNRNVQRIVRGLQAALREELADSSNLSAESD